MVITRGRKIILKAGTLSSEAFQSFAEQVHHHWSESRLKAINRFVITLLDGKYWLLFAKPLPGNPYWLALIFPYYSPLVLVRQEMIDLMEILQPVVGKLADHHVQVEQPLQESHPSPPLGWQIEGDANQQTKDTRVSEQVNHPKGLQNIGLTNHENQSPQVDLPLAQSGQPLSSKLSEKEDLASLLQAVSEGSLEKEAHAQNTAPSPDSEPARMYSPSSFCSDRTNDLVALAETVFDTSFYLVPRHKGHYLLGDLAQHLRAWMPELSETYGWELYDISIRPDYLKWTLLDFPECLTLKALSVVRRRTSNHIFSTFPALQDDLASQDFWSPGYLVDTQSLDFPTQVLIAQVSRERHDQQQPTH